MKNKEAIGKFIILENISFSDMNHCDYMKDGSGKVKVYDTIEDALLVCGMYEFNDVLILEVKHNHVEPKESNEL